MYMRIYLCFPLLALIYCIFSLLYLQVFHLTNYSLSHSKYIYKCSISHAILLYFQCIYNMDSMVTFSSLSVDFATFIILLPN